MLRLDVRGLDVLRGNIPIVRNVSLSLKSGELVALLGPSGSGKSTLLTAMTGFRPGKGRVELCGRDFYAQHDRLKTLVGLVPQDDIVHSALTVEKTLRYAAELRLPAEIPAALRTATVRSVLASVDLAARSEVRVRDLSGGQRKRVSLAVELLAQPPLLFLDEPTSGLDPALEEKMMQLFRSLTGPDRLTVVTTHVLASLEACDLVLMMCAGRLVFIGPPQEAPSFFGVADYPAIYRTLAAGSPETWLEKLEGSPRYRELVVDRLGSAPPPLPSARTEDPSQQRSVAPHAVSAPPIAASDELARLKAARRKGDS